MQYLFILISLVMTFCLSVSSYAEPRASFGQNIVEGWSDKVEYGVHGGVTDIQANEYVYFRSHKVSELIWKTKQALMIDADVSIMLKPSWNQKLNISVSTAVSNSDSTMDDYDWFITGADWTHWSHHDNTTLQQGLVVDLNISQAIYANNLNNITLDMMLGFKRDQWRWQAVGGNYIYSSAQNSLRDTIGVFPDIPGITYEQTFNAPYIGVECNWKQDHVTLGAKIIVSPLVTAEDVDQHHIRNVVFTDTFKGGDMVGGALNVTYIIQENMVFGAFYSFQNFLHNRGDMEMYDQITGQTSFGSDQAGISLTYQTLGVNMRYAF